SISVRSLARHLLPWSLAALALIVPSGLLMFSAHAGDFLNNPAFLVKMGLLLAAGMNAVAFHTGPYQRVAEWDVHATAPLGARLSVAASIALWIGVIACGRLLAYLLPRHRARPAATVETNLHHPPGRLAITRELG